MLEKKQMNNITSLQVMGNSEGLIEYGYNIDTKKFYERKIKRNGVNTFSGTDYGKDYDQPGVVFPLKEGENEPIFSGILQHKKGFVELIHNEYRIFNELKNGDASYQQGRCLSIVRAFDVPKPENKKIKPGLIDRIFETTPPHPKPQPWKQRHSYTVQKFLDGKEGMDLAKEIMEKWSNCDYKIELTIDSNYINHKVKGEEQKIKTVGYRKEANLFGYSTHRNNKSNYLLDEGEEYEYDQDEDDRIVYTQMLAKYGYSELDLIDSSTSDMKQILQLERKDANA